ncbi:hypothetical protein CLU79DRAFT_730866 [Phycomyces nitens]|nr:hypothetical protein CLU79DRAFT_730866 [Phycomyces nitens]
MPPFSFLILLFISSALALSLGDQCDPSVHYSASWQYEDSCDDVYLYCDASSNVCKFKGCSNTDYIKNWDTTLYNLPQRCGADTYCPDDSSFCTPLIPIGGKCEPQRDDECSGNGTVCLNFMCLIKGAPIGGQCGSDRTNYVSYDAEGYSVQQTIIRDNCTIGSYCDDLSSPVCIVSHPNGAQCQQDRECISASCNNDGVCVNGPEIFKKIAVWLWAIVGVAVFLFVILTLAALWVLHRYQARKEHAKILKFFGDNEEFARYAMADSDFTGMYSVQPDRTSPSTSELPSTSTRPNASKSSVVYLGTPDYNESQALGLSRPIQWRNSSTTKLRESPSIPSFHTNRTSQRYSDSIGPEMTERTPEPPLPRP